MSMKPCTKCGHEKALHTGFHLSSKSTDGRASWCKTCVNTTKRASRVRTYTPESRRKWALKSRYGLSEQDIQQMRDAQGGACAICKEVLTKPHIDHCHSSGKVRGLLCHRCNTRLGGLDDAIWRAAALKYLDTKA